MHEFVSGIEKVFRKNSNAKDAAWAKAYLRDQFECFGIKTLLRRELCRDYLNKELPPYTELPVIIKEMWARPWREFQYFAVEILAKYRKEWKDNTIELAEYMIINKSWWDTVDHIASEITGPYFLLFSSQTKKLTGNWNRSENIWLQRSSLMFQKAYKAKTDQNLLSKYILHLRTSDEFFIQKAIGWALREYSKTNPDWVKKFVKANSLPALSAREAVRRIIDY